MNAPTNKKTYIFDFFMPFVVLFVLFCVLRHDLFSAGLVVPIEDFAANDLLIVDAKSFALLHGNYSRVGFYHPGPFFFQVMALFEIVLHDWTGFIKSPVVAAVTAGLFINAAALTMLYGVLVRYFGSRLEALLATLITVVVASLIIDTNQFYNGQLFFETSWPPFLYMSAALLLQAGIIATVVGARYALPLIVTALMMLIHGHASFIGLAPLIAFSLVICVALQSRGKCNVSIGASFRAYMRANRAPILLSVGVILLFAAPILLNTLRNWPGEIPKYFSFAGQRTMPPVWDMMRYWATFMHWSLLAIPAFLLVSYVENRESSRRAVVLLLVGVIPAAVLYSVRGLDTLEYKYPLFWAAPSLAAAVAVAAIELLRIASRPAYRNAWAVFLVAFVVFGFSKFKPHGVFETMPEPEVRAAVDTLRAMRTGDLPVPIDVDGSNVIPIVYTITLAAVDKRLGGNGFCVMPASWNIAESERYKCDQSRYPAGAVLKLKIDDGTGKTLFKIGNVVGSATGT
jgi:hypothetical protein